MVEVCRAFTTVKSEATERRKFHFSFEAAIIPRTFLFFQVFSDDYIELVFVEINREPVSIVSWARVNKLSLNIKKNKAIAISGTGNGIIHPNPLILMPL